MPSLPDALLGDYFASMARQPKESSGSAVPPQPHRPRRSACADASRQAELERLRAMTVAERMRAALAIKGRFQGLRPVSVAPRQP
jgi:hypothetical protein